jgi:putative salt-induced outer membrane protein YdiY
MLSLLPLLAWALHGAAAPVESTDAVAPRATAFAPPASTGSTELAEQGKFATDAGADARDADDATEGEIAAGGALASGNARSFQGTVNGRVRVRRRAHEGRAAVAGNYGRAAADVSAPVETTVLNVQGMVRYDYFFAPRWSAFLMATARHDRFQGLDLRLNIDPGVAFYAVQKPNHRLWFEAGYDFQLDLRRDEAIFVREENDADGDGTIEPEEVTVTQIADERQVNHAARLFAGYTNTLSERVSFDTGLEYLQSVIVAQRLRLNWINALSIQLAGRVGLAATFTLRYENQPLPGVEKLDTMTAIQLTLRFL